MKLKDFKEAVKSLLGGDYSFEKEKGVPADSISISWSTGGVSGGSCWESSNPQPYASSEKKPDFDSLDKVLQQFAPQITYLQYRQLSKKVQYAEWTEREYYGNCTDYACEYITISDLYDFLKEQGCL